MRRFITFALALFLLIPSSIELAQGAAKAGGSCSRLNQTEIVKGWRFTCIKVGSKFQWDKGVNVAKKESATQNKRAGSTPQALPVQEGIICDIAKVFQAKDSKGTLLTCTRGSDGKYAWFNQAKSQAGQNNDAMQILLNGPCSSTSPAIEKTSKGIEVECKLNSAGSYMWTEVVKTPPVAEGSVPNQNVYALGALGSGCTSDGKLAWNGSFVVICKDGKVRYALSADFPKSANGFTSRPEWYPELSEIMIPGSNKPTCSSNTITFTKPVVPIDQMAPTIPYGMMVYDHITPIDHAYIGIKSLYKSASGRSEADYVPVTAPADGKIIQIASLGSPTSHRVVIDHGCGVYSAYLVLNKFAGALATYQAQVDAGAYINPKLQIKAGEIFGMQRDNPLDFNVWDASKWLSGFAAPSSYLSGDAWKPYTVDYLPFFTPELRSAMESQLQRTVAPRVGKIDYDAMGGSAGNWYLEKHFGYGCIPNSVYQNQPTTPIYRDPDTSKVFYGWCHLAIAPHQVDPSAWIFSVGWWKNQSGDSVQAVLNVNSGQVAPDKLQESNGVVIYTLSSVSNLEPAGSPARIEGGSAPFAIGYKVAPYNQIGSVAMQIKSDGSLAISISTDGSTLNGIGSNPRIYTR